MAVDKTASARKPEKAKIPALSGPARIALKPTAQRVFWWGEVENWLNDPVRFAAQVMTWGDWQDTRLALLWLGDSVFRQALQTPPTGVFDVKSWHFWHNYYHLETPPFPPARFSHVSAAL